MIEKGANDWDYGLKGACLGGHIDLVLFMIERGAEYWEFGIKNARKGGHNDLVLFMIEKYTTEYRAK